MTYALDTNIVIHYLRNEPNVREHFNKTILRGDNIVIPKIAHYEIRRGFRIQGAPNKEKLYDELIGITGYCAIAEPDGNCWERAEQVYADLYHKRFTVGELDILIAALCLENDFVLVTSNVKDFENIEGLNVENWTE